MMKKSLTMQQPLPDILAALSRPGSSNVLRGIRRGVERESLRVNDNAGLTQTAHPASLGSPLTHPWITTDFAEALLEFVTPVGSGAEEVLATLTDIQRYTYRHLGDELLWPLSMPCTIETEDEITLARYGNSNLGKVKTLYRRGLKNRYGSMMQAIAGVHYNFSMPDNFWPVWQQIRGDQQPLRDFVSECYLGLIRNFMRLGWLIPYLFGASPAVDSSFLRGTRNALALKSIGKTSHYLPQATSLRLSKLGYTNTAQEQLHISYNSLDEFVGTLRQALNQPDPVFAQLGVKRHGQYQQLNTNTLQNESELYAPIRPKLVPRPGEKLTDALLERGIEYVEIRCLDVNPYAATGIDLDQIRFLDIFLTYCLLKDSPEISEHEQRTTMHNLDIVALGGRDLSLKLQDGHGSILMAEWATEIFDALGEVALLFDQLNQGEEYRTSLNRQHQKVLNPALTPSAKLLHDMANQELEVNELALRLAHQHRRELLETDFSRILPERFKSEAQSSLKEQRKIEDNDTLSFADYLFFTNNGNIPCISHPECTDECCQWPALSNSIGASCEVFSTCS